MKAEDDMTILRMIRRISPLHEQSDAYHTAVRDLLDCIDRFAERAAMGSAPAEKDA